MSEKEYTATGVRRIFNATGYSLKGIKTAWNSEAAVRQEFILSMLLAPLAFVFAKDITQLVLMLISLFIVVITELLNSAVEYTVDRIGKEHHELSGSAKDIASAAVFFSLSQVVVVWGLIISYNQGLFSLPLF